MFIPSVAEVVKLSLSEIPVSSVARKSGVPGTATATRFARTERVLLAALPAASLEMAVTVTGDVDPIAVQSLDVNV